METAAGWASAKTIGLFCQLWIKTCAKEHVLLNTEL